MIAIGQRIGARANAFLSRTVRIFGRDVPIAVVAPIVVSAVVRAVFAYTDNTVQPDEAAYLETGRNIWGGHGVTYRGRPELHFPPLLPIILGALSKVLPEPHHATVLVTFLASLALVPIIGALAWRVGGRRAGILAMWIAALTPGLSVTLARGAGGSEGLFVTIMFAAALVTVGSGRWDDPPSLLRALAVGALVGAAYLVRPEGVPIIALFGVILAVRAVGGRIDRRVFTLANARRVVALGLACAAGLLAFVGPYLGFLHSHTGKWELTAKSVDVNVEAWRALAGQDRAKRDIYLYKLSADGHTATQPHYSLTVLAREHPRAYLGIVKENLRQLYKSLLSLNTTRMPGWRLFALPLLPFALFALWKRKMRSAVIAIAGIGCLALVTVVGFFVLNRYLPPLVAALCVLAGIGLSEIADRRRNWWVGLGLVASVFSLMTYFEGPHGPQLVRERPDVQIAARWMREHHIPASAAVMTRSTNLPYYLPDNHFVSTPVATLEQLWRYAHFQNVQYFLFDPTTQLWRPQLRELLDGVDHRAEGFEAVHTFHVQGRITIIFKLLPTRTSA